MINIKILDKRLYLMEYAPPIFTCLLILILFVYLNFTYRNSADDLHLNYLNSFFNEEQNLDLGLFEKHSKSLLLTGIFQSISLLDQNREVIAHYGLPLSQNDLTTIRDGASAWSNNNIKHLLLSAKNPDKQQNFSIHVASSTKNIELWVYRSLLLVIGIMIVALAIIYSVSLRFKRIFKEESDIVETAISELINGKYGYTIENTNDTLFQPLKDRLNELSYSLKNSTQKLQHTIDQSVKDLEETLETVEIQNIEIDLARKNAIKANQAKSEFLASTSHEIRTPLNGILGFTNLMRKTKLTPQQEEYLETIEDSAQVLLLNINDIIDFSRLEIGKLNLEYKPIYLKELIKESQKYIITHSNLLNVDLSTDEKSAIPEKLLGDPLRIKQVYTNLLSNALSLCQSHKITTGLEIQNREDHQSLLRVELVCQGESLDDRERQIAQTLLRSSDPAHEKLTNKNHMGLVIAKGLVERMNGEIGLSARERTIIFWFTVLLGKPNTDEVSKSKDAIASILVVDDNTANRRLICELLSDFQIQVVSAGSGEDAIELCKQQNFSLVLMDIQMPGLNGFETTQVIRKNEKNHQRTPIVALTAHAVEDAKSQLLLSGMDDFVSKPIGETELKELLNRWISYATPAAQITAATQHDSIEQAQTIHQTPQPEEKTIVEKTATEEKSSDNRNPVDIAQSLQLTKGKADLAKEMLVMLISAIETELPKIRLLWDTKEYKTLQNLVHQLHGGACYCGVPRLLTASKAFDKALLNEQYQQCEPLAAAFVSSCEELLEWAEHHDLEILFDLDSTP